MKFIPLTFAAFLDFAAALINLFYLILVLVRTSRTTLYVTFAFICMANIVWNIGSFIEYVTGNHLWYYFSRIGSSMLPALMFHLILTFLGADHRRSNWVRVAYVLSGLFGLSSLLALLLPDLRWVIDTGLRNILYLLVLGPILFAGIVFALVGMKRTNRQDERERLLYILLAAIIGVFTGLTETVQFLGIPIPRLGHLGCLIYSSILAIGIFKHREAYDILAQMQEKLESLGELAAGIAHEIRNPLTSIKGASNLLAGELKHLNLPSNQEYCNIIREEIDRLDHILLNFQYFTRPLRIEKELVDVDEIIWKTVKLAETGPVNITIRQQLSGNAPKVKADASLLKQVFLNLIKNADEACGSDGELVIRTGIHSPSVRISFTDNGPGIPAENLNRIFEPFFTTKSTGMGMGLAICRRIIQAHGGELEVKNRLPKGTEFTIVLPIQTVR
jgi:signal transduction histidine kinase